MLSSAAPEVEEKLISNEQRSNFFRDGYIIVKDVYSADEIARGREIITEAFNRDDWKSAPLSNETIINDIYTLYPELAGIIFNEKYARSVKEIVGENAGIVPECAIHHNRYFDWHKDTTSGEANGNFVHKHPKALFIVAATYFQPNTADGGGLTVVPGSQNSEDRFIKEYYGSFLDRCINKLRKLTNTSLFQQIEKHETVVDVPHKEGDLVLFHLSLDHRATFKRHKRSGKPIQNKGNKFAVFNTFSPANHLAQEYINYLKTRKEPYYQYLRSSTLPEIFVNKMNEHELTVYS